MTFCMPFISEVNLYVVGLIYFSIFLWCQPKDKHNEKQQQFHGEAEFRVKVNDPFVHSCVNIPIIPVPKKSGPSELNHLLLPASLQNVSRRCYWLPSSQMLALSWTLTSSRIKSGTEDEVASLLHTLLQHLISPGHSWLARPFIDCSLQRHLIISKLHHLHVTSPIITVNTGAPPGWTPFYTHQWRS